MNETDLNPILNSPVRVLILTLVIVALSLPYYLVTGQDTILLDVGKPELQSSAETDPNGYHWNNMAPDPEAPNGRLGWEILTEQEKLDQPWFTFEDYFVDYVGLPYTVVENMVDTSGNPTGVSLLLTGMGQRFQYNPPTSAGGSGRSGEEYGDALGPIPTETGYPGTATVDSFYINFDYRAEFVLVGLDDSETYTLKFWGGLNRESVPTAWKVGDRERKVIESFNNTGAVPEDYAIFEDVSPVDGEIHFYFEQGIEPDNLKPDGKWSTLEIVGNFSGGSPATWYGYSLDENSWADSGSWLGWINALYDPAIYSLSLDRYIFVLDDSGWVYVPK